MSLYLIILIISLAAPLALSFEKNLRRYKLWKYLLSAIVITLVVYDYNPLVILGIDVLSFPFDAMFYKFSLLLSPLVLTLIFEMRSKKTKNA